MERITLTINKRKVEAEPGITVLEAARQANIYIPTLCYHRDLGPEGHCRVCLVEIAGQRTLQPACAFPAAEGMEVNTHSPKVREARRLMLELLLSNHPNECLTCVRSRNCELQRLAKEMGIEETRLEGERKREEVDESSFVIRDNEKCVLCRRCVRVCQGLQSVGALAASQQGWETVIGPAFARKMSEIVCVNCGQCVSYCPTGALRERDATRAAWAALEDPSKFVVVQTAPAVRVAVGEEMGLPRGSLVAGQMVAALRELGFARVFDTDFTADLTIVEAALRTTYEVITGKALGNIDFEMVRGLEGIRTATIPVGDLGLRVAVAHGLSNARKLLDLIRERKANFHFVEVMACPGGCLGGGGQPIPVDNQVRKARASSIYQADQAMPIRKSHENPIVTRIYAEFLGKPLGHRSHQLLHTHYTPRGAGPTRPSESTSGAEKVMAGRMEGPPAKWDGPTGRTTGE